MLYSILYYTIRPLRDTVYPSGGYIVSPRDPTGDQCLLRRRRGALLCGRARRPRRRARHYGRANVVHWLGSRLTIQYIYTTDYTLCTTYYILHTTRIVFSMQHTIRCTLLWQLQFSANPKRNAPRERPGSGRHYTLYTLYTTFCIPHTTHYRYCILYATYYTPLYTIRYTL